MGWPVLAVGREGKGREERKGQEMRLHAPAGGTRRPRRCPECPMQKEFCCCESGPGPDSWGWGLGLGALSSAEAQREVEGICCNARERENSPYNLKSALPMCHYLLDY